jgi:2-polyprenyl-3-methyl-5-hydroxy-6-metoxy-1,4-benzoquinol methylase
MSHTSSLSKPLCSCCGNDNAFSNIGARAGWSYFRCSACGDVQLAPVPSSEALERFYNHEYRVLLEGHIRQMTDLGRKSLQRLEAMTKGRRLLEIGCSYGAFLSLARERGWSCVGIEASREAATKAAQANSEVYAGTVEDNIALLAPNHFDVVVMWHVIEHLTNAPQVLRAIHPLLKQGGYLILRTPNADSLGAHLLGRWWEWFHGPEHIHLYTARGIELLFNQCGFRVDDVSSRRGDALTLISQAVTACGAFVIGRLKTAGSSLTRTGKRDQFGYLYSLHRRLSSLTDLVGRPVDSLLGLNGRNLRGSELLVVGSKG